MKLKAMSRVSGSMLGMVMLFAALPAHGQFLPTNPEWVDPAKAYHLGAVDYFGWGGLQAAFDIPLLVDTSQRGSLNFTYSLKFAAWNQWDLVPNGVNSWWWLPTLISQPHFSMNGRLTNGSEAVQLCEEEECETFYWHYVKDDTGQKHYVAGSQSRAIDGSGIKGYTLITDRNGVQFQEVGPYYDTQYITDPNGNRLIYACSPQPSCVGAYPGYTITDTVGRVWTWNSDTSETAGCPVSSYKADTWDVPGLNGGTRRFKFCYSWQALYRPTDNSYVADRSYMTGVVLPDQTTWRFDYDQYGNFIKLYLPTGGWISYTWTIPPHGDTIRFQQTSRTVNDGASSYTWDFSTPGGWTDPFGNQRSGTSPSEGVSETKYYQGSVSSGTLLKTETRTCLVLENPLPESSESGGCLPLGTTTTWPNGQVSKIEYEYDPGFNDTETNWYFDHNVSNSYHSVYGMVTAERHYDYGSGAPGPLLSKTTTNYIALSDSNYLSANLLTLPSSQSVWDGSGNKCAQADYGYDDPARLVSSGVTVQHVSPPGPKRGNLTSTARKLFLNPCQSPNPTTSDVPSFQNVYDTGTVRQSVDARGNSTTYEYVNENPNWYGSRLSKVTNALGHVTNYQYDWPSGLLTYVQDPNGQWTHFVYDNMLRVTQITAPDSGQGNATYSPTSISVSQTIAQGQSSMTTTKLYDGVGRLKQSQLTSDPQGTVSTDTTYDLLGRVDAVCNPHRSTGSPTDGCTSYKYDALNRVTKLIPPDGTENSNYILTEYGGNVTTVTDQAGKQRRSYTDGLGRLVRVDEPSVGATPTPGTGSATANGTEQSVTGGGQPGSGSVTVSGAEQVYATPGTGSVTINGSVGGGNVWDDCADYDQDEGECIGDWVWETAEGTIKITVNGSPKSVTFSSTSHTASNRAAALRGAINADSNYPVTAGGSNGTITLTAKQSGSGTNYSLAVTVSSSWGNSYTGTTKSGPTLTGGTTIYDTGSVRITVNGYQATANYAQGSTATAIATSLRAALNNASSPVTASGTGTTVTMTAKTNGISTNYTVSNTSWTNDTAHFSQVSFSASGPSGGTLLGGLDDGTTYDTGTVWVTVNGVQSSVSYGQSSTSVSLATALANAINSGNSYVAASVIGSTINLTATSGGITTNYSLAAGSSTDLPGTFTPPSFSVSVSGSSLQGGTGWGGTGLGSPYTTLYFYDPLGNLTCVEQHGDASGTGCASPESSDPSSNWRIRRFKYDSLSRLTSAKNPEAGTTTYTYDGNGNLLTKTDARGIVTNYNPSGSPIDPLNRVLQKTYSDGTPTASFAYDNCANAGGCPSGFTLSNAVGRIVKASTPSAQTFYSYDVMGRNTALWQCTPLNCGGTFVAFTYGYNYLGGQTSLAYNGAFTVSQAYDAAARVTQATNSVSDTYNPPTLVSIAAFAPTGAPTQIALGNGLAETRAYNNRQQVTLMRVYKPSQGSLDVLNEQFTWANAQSQNNGNLILWNGNGMLPASGTFAFNRSYTYDDLNRLTGMSAPVDPSGCLGLVWTYDPWGNRPSQATAPNGGSCGNFNATFAQVNNRMDGYSYDAAGNLLGDGSHTYAYDAENRIKSVDSGATTYTYDANGNRIQKTTGSNQVHYFYGQGEVLVEKNQSGAIVKEYIYAAGQRMERSGGQTKFIHTDHLGSARTVTTYNADSLPGNGGIADALDYYPFGEQIGGDTATTHKFTGKERDSESGLDNFGARYDSSWMGRFMSPDEPFADQDQSDPQSWNLYSYVRNNPLAFTDPTGRCRKGDDGRAHDDDDGPCVEPEGTSVTVKATPLPLPSLELRPEIQLAMREANDRLQDANTPGDRKRAEIVIPIGPLGGLRALGAAGETSALARLSGILRDAAAKKGNFPLGTASSAEAAELGKAWVGPGATLASDGKTLVSADRLRVYRPPAFKPGQGATQANFERKIIPGARPVSNGHLTIR